MVTEERIIEAYVFLRENNQSIPDEVLDFMKSVAIEKLNEIKDFGRKWNNFKDLHPEIDQRILYKGNGADIMATYKGQQDPQFKDVGWCINENGNSDCFTYWTPL